MTAGANNNQVYLEEFDGFDDRLRFSGTRGL